MNLRRSLMATTAALAAISGFSFGQQSDENPFPDVLARSVLIRLCPGWFTSEIKWNHHPGTRAYSTPNPYQYFRMAVSHENATEVMGRLSVGR
jgi:hypothetical protein